MLFPKPQAPTGDKRWRIVDATMRRNGYQGHALIETLHSIQEAFGYLEPEGLRFVAHSLRVPLSQVYGAATFYHFFTMKPPGRHTCVVCTGTACYIKGAPGLIAAIEDRYGIRPGQTTGDGELSLLTARCVGSCSIAPVAVFDRDVAGKLTPEETVNRASRFTEVGQAVSPAQPGQAAGSTSRGEISDGA
jgi:bidirectional [NiFe] hydrogenase diaphorase subunit